MENFTSTYFFNTSFLNSLFSNDQNVWQTIDLIESYFENYTFDTSLAKIDSRAYLENHEMIAIGAGSVVEPGAYIKGPCIIGKNCQIRHGAYLRGNTIIGDNSIIGHDTEVKNSILLSHVEAAHFAYIGDSILGNYCWLGAGVKIANVRFDKAPITINYNGKNYPSERKKLGAIIGDGSKIGCNSVLNPGTLLGQEVTVFPGSIISGFTESKCFLKPDINMKKIVKSCRAS